MLRASIALLALAACGTTTDDRPETAAYITAAILAPNCGRASCHASGTASHGFVFDTLENARPSLRDLVVPGDAARSELIDILTRSVKHLQNRWVGHQFEEGRQIQPLGQRVYQHFGGGTGHLYQTQFRPEGRFSQEFRIDGNEFRLGQLTAGRLQLGGSFDHLNTFIGKIVF